MKQSANASQIGRVIAARMRALEINQAKIARDIQLTPAAVSKLVKGSNPERDTLSKLREVLKVDGDTLLDACDGKLDDETIVRLSSKPGAEATAQHLARDVSPARYQPTPLLHATPVLLELYATASRLSHDRQEQLLRQAHDAAIVDSLEPRPVAATKK